MPDTTNTSEQASEQAFTRMMDALIEIMRSGVRPDVLEAQRVLLQRLAHQGDVFPARIPAPRNITEIGGYLNLLERAGLLDTRASAVASALGVAAPLPTGNATPQPAPVGFVDIGNDRPAGAAQASITPSLHVRADFATALMQARATVHDAGASLPLRALRPALPDAQPGATATGLDDNAVLAVLGRRLEVFPGTVLRDPATDPLAIARPNAPPDAPWRLVARVPDDSSTVLEALWIALRASASAVIEEPPTDRRLLEVDPLLAAAGWIHPSPMQPPATLHERGSLAQWINLTGLIAGETRLGDELALLYTPAAIARSALAAFIGWRWSGERFTSEGL